MDSMLKRNDDDMHYALMLIDLDAFKSVNDTFGHACGDKVLAGFDENLRHTFRSGGSLGRLGGDKEYKGSASIGVSVLPENGSTFSSLTKWRSARCM